MQAPIPLVYPFKKLSICAGIISIVFICGCAKLFEFRGTSEVNKNPCITLALPASGPYSQYTGKIKRGAVLAQNELKKNGINLRLESINTENQDWLQQLMALPQECVLVGGPLRDKKYTEARKAGALEKKIFFPFLPTLVAGDEGKLAWRFFPSQQDQIEALINLVTDQLNIRTYGAFYPSDNYGSRMSKLLEDRLANRHMTLQKASYNPAAPASWSKAAEPLIQPSYGEGRKTPIPQTTFEALFVPDSWKHMDMITTSLLYNGEDRLMLLGTTLWEAGLSGKMIPKAEKFALAVFPGAFDSNRVTATLKGVDKDFWVALGFDFINFAAATGLDTRKSPGEINQRVQKAAPMVRAIAPINWDNSGIAHQKLYLFQVGPHGKMPVNIENIRQTRMAVQERAALRMQGLPSNPEEMPAQASEQTTQAVVEEPAQPDIQPIKAEPQVEQPVMSTVPVPSYKLRLPTKK